MLWQSKMHKYTNTICVRVIPHLHPIVLRTTKSIGEGGESLVVCSTANWPRAFANTKLAAAALQVLLTVVKNPKKYCGNNLFSVFRQWLPFV